MNSILYSSAIRKRPRISASPFVILALTCIIATSNAKAGYMSDFEGLGGSVSGTTLNGQDGFFAPIGPPDVSFDVYTYTGNTLGISQNPTGGSQFVAGTGPGGGALARSQRNADYTGNNVWNVSTDILVDFTGQLPSAQNVGSLSTQNFPGEATFVALATWSDPNTAVNWNADYVWFNTAGTQLLELVPNVDFQNLSVNHWYNWSTIFDLATNRILEVSLKDLTTNITATHNPIDRYLFGGAAGAPTPTGFRFFAGTPSVAGNTMAFDNFSIASVPEPATLTLFGLGLAGLGLARRRKVA